MQMYPQAWSRLVSRRTEQVECPGMSRLQRWMACFRRSSPLIVSFSFLLDQVDARAGEGGRLGHGGLGTTLRRGTWHRRLGCRLLLV
jgi:hypothetical protein